MRAPTRRAHFVYSQAVKSGGKFVEAAIKTLPFWKAAYDARGPAFVEFVRDTQRGTKLIQARTRLVGVVPGVEGCLQHARGGRGVLGPRRSCCTRHQTLRARRTKRRAAHSTRPPPLATQNICNESKVQKSAQMLSKAPAAKKALERFVFEARARARRALGAG